MAHAISLLTSSSQITKESKMRDNPTNPALKTFLTVWLGQSVSLIGSGLTSFALGVWVFEGSGSITQFALIGLFAVLPRVLLSPMAGVIVDRWDRRRAMILSDAGAGLCTLSVVVLLTAGRLEVWHIFLLTAASSSFSALQWPAYMAAIALLVPNQHLGRANGLVQLGRALSEILAPALAGILMSVIGLQGVILIDFATFGFAVLTLLPVRFPIQDLPPEKGSDKFDLRAELTFGRRYIAARPGLCNLLAFSAVVNFLWGMVGALITPMILGFTTTSGLGGIISVAGFGMLAGSLVMSIWGGPRRRINGVLFFEMLSGVCFLLIGSRPAFWPVAFGALGAHMTIAVVFGSNQSIWQSKVEPGAQGRVFAFQQMVASAAVPLAYLLAGPLAEKIFEPLLTEGGALASSAGSLIGVGPGRGIAFVFIIMGLIKIAVALWGYLNPHVRDIEDELPDAVGVLTDAAAA
jgi:DHA3 family macrolide efflux protein-like MFS transporter